MSAAAVDIDAEMRAAQDEALKLVNEVLVEGGSVIRFHREQLSDSDMGERVIRCYTELLGRDKSGALVEITVRRTVGR